MHAIVEVYKIRHALSKINTIVILVAKHAKLEFPSIVAPYEKA